MVLANCRRAENWNSGMAYSRVWLSGPGSRDLDRPNRDEQLVYGSSFRDPPGYQAPNSFYDGNIELCGCRWLRMGIDIRNEAGTRLVSLVGPGVGDSRRKRDPTRCLVLVACP